FAAAEEEATARGTDVLELTESGALPLPPEPPLPDPDRLTRSTASQAPVPSRRDTSYSVTRAGLRDAVADPERYPASPPPLPLPRAPRPDPANPEAPAPAPSPHPQSQPLARIMRRAPAVLPPPPQKTMLGVPAAPAADPPPTRRPR